MAELTTTQSVKQSVRQFTKKASDTWKITGARLSRSETKALDVALVKATSSKTHVPPKEKHVRTLKMAMTSPSSGDYVIRGLLQRLHEATDWLTALKTLITVHRLLAETSEGVWDELIHAAGPQDQAKTGPLGVDNFIDTTNIAGRFDYSEFVRAYGKYLDEQLAVFKALRWNCSTGSAGSASPQRRTSESDEFGSERGWNAGGPGSSGTAWSAKQQQEQTGTGGTSALSFRNMPPDQLLAALPRLQRLQRRLMDCVPRGSSSGDPVALAALDMVVRESYRLYRVISEGGINLADAYFSMPYLEASRALDMYREAAAATEALSAFYGTVEQLGGAHSAHSMPTLTPIPPDFIVSMEEYLAVAPRPDGDTPGPRPAGPLRRGRLAASQVSRDGAGPATTAAPGKHSRTMSTDPGMVLPLGVAADEGEGEEIEPSTSASGTELPGGTPPAAAPNTAQATLSPLDLLLGELTIDAPPQNGVSANPFAQPSTGAADPFALPATTTNVAHAPAVVPPAPAPTSDPFAFPSSTAGPQTTFDPFALSSPPAQQPAGTFWTSPQAAAAYNPQPPRNAAGVPPPLDLGALQAPNMGTPGGPLSSMRGNVAAGTPQGEDLVKAAGARDPFAGLSMTPQSGTKPGSFPSPRTGGLL